MLGECEKAIEHATVGMELTEESKENNCLYLITLHVLINVYCKTGKWDEAEACCVKALEIRDDFIDALYCLARIYMIKNDCRRALLTYHTFLEKKRLIDSEPERGIFYRSLDSWGREAEVHNDLGGIFHQNGNFDRAIQETRKAIALLPHDARSHCNLGSTLAAKGDLKGAEVSFKKALEMEPAYPMAEEGLKRVRSTLGT
jgi:pentatricopeptide repeat protein